MNKSLKTMLGVTLLEIMLVLAIAGIIIAMSVRYFGQASTNQKVTSAISGITAMVSAVEQWRLQGKALSSLTNDDIKSYFTADSIPKSPWTNDPMTAKGGSVANTYVISTKTSDIGSCNLLADQMSTQPGYTGVCSTGNAVDVTVNTVPGGGAAS